MAKKVCIVVVTFVLVAVVAFFGIREYVANSHNDEDTLTTVESDILIMSEKYPTKVLIYGDTLEFDSKIATEQINEITYESLKKDDEFAYQLLVINDLSGEYALSDGEWDIVKDVVNAGYDINFIYLGEKQFDKIFDAGIVEKDVTVFEDGDLSLGAFYEGKNKISVYGTYTSEFGTSQKEICEAIMHEQAYNIKMGNE